MATTFWREHIKKYRLQLGLTQAQLAAKLEKTQQTIGNWESGFNEPSLNDMYALTKIFGITTDDFFSDLPADTKKNGGSKKNKNSSFILNKEESDNIVAEAGDAYNKSNVDSKALQKTIALQQQLIESQAQTIAAQNEAISALKAALEALKP